jgi:hypothetical protein
MATNSPFTWQAVVGGPAKRHGRLPVRLEIGKEAGSGDSRDVDGEASAVRVHLDGNGAGAVRLQLRIARAEMDAKPLFEEARKLPVDHGTSSV